MFLQRYYTDTAEFGTGGYSCGTGDSFVTETPKLKTDLVDMEAYAIAKICYLQNIKFKCFKYISDYANENSNNDWIDNCSKGAKLFSELYPQLKI